MKYFGISRQPSREVAVPSLSGGLNLRDCLSGIRDNQLTDCVNLWYKNGALKTRPGFKYFDQIPDNSDLSLTVTNDYDYGALKTHGEIVNNKGSVLVSFKAVLSGEETTVKSKIFFWWQSEDEYKFLNSLNTYDCDYFVVQKNNSIFCFIDNGSIYKCDFESDKPEWILTDKEEMYTPTVLSHCQRTGVYGYNGVHFEGYNLLTPRFKVIYSAYNENDSDSSHPMRYNFGTKIATEGTVKATFTYTDANGCVKTCVHSVDASGLSNNRWVYEKTPQGDGLAMYACREYVGFSSENGSDTMPAKRLNNDADVEKYGPVEDNLIIEANVYQSAAYKDSYLKKVFKMTQSIWFGGTASGINGGSRLFLCGNTDENEKALVLWSGLNEPLYFNENNYAYVGNKSQPVTAFGKQGQNLVLFKPNETYYSYYKQNSDITAESLTSQSIVDYEANRVIFPVITLHSSVGCDCPKTVQLCRNRLVWLNSDGKIYTLVTANQYSEMTIYCVSEMIENKIKGSGYNPEQLKSAVSHDFDGHYILIVGNDAYVMDYNSYGYTHIYSYSKGDDANCMIPWYFWKLLPIDGMSEKEAPVYCGIGNAIAAVYLLRPEGSYYTAHCSILKYVNDTGKDEIATFPDSDNKKLIITSPVTSLLKTKQFEFSAPNYLKNIDRVDISFGNNGGSEISVGFITNAGGIGETVFLTNPNTNENSESYITCKKFNISVKSVRNFGVKVRCEGKLIINSISVKYRLLGSVK